MPLVLKYLRPGATIEERRAYKEYLCNEERKEEEENLNFLENAKEETDPSIAAIETATLDCTRCGKEKELTEFIFVYLFDSQICTACIFRYRNNLEIHEQDEKSLSILEKIWTAVSVPLEDLQVELMARVKRWRRCPNCRMYVQRIGHNDREYGYDNVCVLSVQRPRIGLDRFNTVRCRCGTKFCYDCGDIARPGGRCTCNRFDWLQIFPDIWSEVHRCFYRLIYEGCNWDE